MIFIEKHYVLLKVTYNIIMKQSQDAMHSEEKRVSYKILQ